MDNEMPLVSVITPSFNQGRFIEYAILSIKNQDYPNIEHIIVDGGSTDNTQDIIRKYDGKYNLRWISEPDRGQSDAVNKGFKMANGDIIGWINSDDAYFSKFTIHRTVKFFEEHKRYAIVYGDTILIDSNNIVIRIAPILPTFNYSALKMRNILAQPSVFFKKCIIEEYQLNPRLHYGMDYDFWLRVGAKNKFYHMDDILSCFRLHELSKSVAQFDLLENEFAAIAQNYKLPLEKIAFLDRATHAARILLPMLYLPRALQLYSRKDLAFDIRLPSRQDLIRNTLLIPELRDKLKMIKDFWLRNH